MGGRSTPIHTDGRWCPAASSSASFLPPSRPFCTVASYINPNAICPVCGATVFFYQSPNGGRVFFDALGWPWPKHRCTDNKVAQIGTVRQPKNRTSGSVIFRDAAGTSLQIYELTEMPRQKDGWIIKLSRPGNSSFFRLSISDTGMKAAKLKVEDLRGAPSFVVAPSISGHPTRRIQFISGRLKKIVTIELPKA